VFCDEEKVYRSEFKLPIAWIAIVIA